MGRFWLQLIAIFLLILTACDREKAVEKALRVKFDPALTKAEKALLVNDVYALMRNKMKPRANSSFAKIFGQLGAPDVVRYLDERINYLISSRTLVNGSLRWTDSALGDLFYPTRPRDPIDLVATRQSFAAPPGVSEAAVQTVAENLGITLWVLQEASRPSRVAFQLGDARIPLLSSRVGLVRIGGAYPTFSPVVRMSTLVHEARHSDCTGGLSRESIQRYRDGRGLGPQKCGHLHARCPVGHEYEGELACDALPWGAYAVESVYAAGMAELCSNCSRIEKQLARMLKLEAASRVLVLDAMTRGELGPPDMSSTGVNLQDIRDTLKNLRNEREQELK